MGETVPTKIVLFGAGGHAKVVIDTCARTEFLPVVCFGESRWDQIVGVPVAAESTAAQWRRQGVGHAFVAIGSNAIRRRVADKARELGFELVTIVSPRAIMSSTAKVGAGTIVMAGAVIQVEAEIGDLAIINTGASVDHECKLGVAVHVAPHATLCGNVVAGDGVWVGAGSTIVEDTTIAANVFIAAGATVVGDISQPGARYGGVPARPLRT